MMSHVAERIFVKRATKSQIRFLLSLASAKSCDPLMPLSICLGEDSIDQSYVQLIASALSSGALIRRLSFEGISTGFRLRSVVEALKHNTHIEELYLRNAPFDPKDGILLAASLVNNRSLKKLDLVGTNFDAVTTALIFETLSKNSTLTSLSISRCHWDLRAAHTLASVLATTHSRLVDLQLLQAVGMSHESFVIVADALSKNTSLTSLGLDVTSLLRTSTVSTGWYIEHILKKNSTLQSLCLWNGKNATISDTVSDHQVAACLFDGPHLRQLKIYGFGLSTDTCVHVAEKLKNSSLEQLSFVACSLSLDQTRPIAEALQLNSRLRKIDLSTTLIGDDAAFELGTALMANVSIESLNLSYCELTCRGVKSIVTMLSKNEESPLQVLSLSHNKILRPGAEALSLLLRSKSTKVNRLLLSHNQIGTIGFLDLLTAAGENHSVNLLDARDNSIDDSELIFAAISNGSIKRNCLVDLRLENNALSKPCILSILSLSA